MARRREEVGERGAKLTDLLVGWSGLSGGVGKGESELSASMRQYIMKGTWREEREEREREVKERRAHPRARRRSAEEENMAPPRKEGQYEIERWEVCLYSHGHPYLVDIHTGLHAVVHNLLDYRQALVILERGYALLKS